MSAARNTAGRFATVGDLELRYEVVVIGGGQAGLAMGYHLAQQGRRFTILDAGSAPAAAWRSRWDSLRLFTPARYDSLPGFPFPGDPAHHPSRDEVVAYLTDYARHFQLPVELDSRVRALRAADHGYEIELADRRLQADQVVVATGPFQTPRIPAIAHELTAAHRHSADYRSPADVAVHARLGAAGMGDRRRRAHRPPRPARPVPARGASSAVTTSPRG